MQILAIDLGGTSAKIALFENEKIINRKIILTDLKNIFGNIKNKLDWDLKDVAKIGIAVPGFIDNKTSFVTLSGNLKLKNFNIKKIIKDLFNKEVFVINDANAAALGEYWKGAGKVHNSIAFYTIGTGIGGGIIINNQLVTGHDGYAGEFGHGGNFQNQFKCTCGLKNCLEPLSSATGIEKLLQIHFQKKVTIKEVAQQLATGNSEIKKIFKDALRPLAMHICIIQTALNPDAIIIGGGPSALGEPLRQLIEEIVAASQLKLILDSSPILLAKTKNDAGLYGAAYWAIRGGK